MEQSAELTGVILRFYEALSSGDISTIERLISRHDGVVAIGSDPSEWWAEYPTIAKVFKAQMEEMGGFQFVGGAPRAYSEGGVGWVSDRPKLKLPNGTEIPFRITCVFHKEDGEWTIVQMHASIGVPNEDLLGKELTV